MSKEYTVSLREATGILGKKPATVRAYVRSGRLSKQYVDGFNGQEMRLNKEELDELKKSLKEGNSQPIERVSNDTVDNTVKTVSAENSVVHSSDPTLTRAIELLESQLTDLRKEKEQLHQESKELTDKNFHMAGQLGYFQNQVETLKDQVKQLSAPAETKSSSSKKQKSGGFFSFLGIGKR